MITSPDNSIIFFVEFNKSTKRFSGAKPANLTELRDGITQKFSNIGDSCKIQIKDADFQVVCDLEDIEQLYSGAKIIIEDEGQMEEANMVVDDSTVASLRTENEQLRKENAELRKQIENQLPVTRRAIPEGFHVRLAGVPYEITEEQIRSFFTEQKIVDDGVWILPEYGSKMGRGEALVTFDSEADRDAAVKKHGEHIGARWIEVRAANMDDFVRYQQILEAYQQLANPNFLKARHIVKLQGFEYAHREEDIEKFLEPAIPLKIWIIYNKRAKNSGVAFVELIDKKSLKQTLAKKKQYVGDRYIDVWEATVEQFKFVLAQMCGQEIKQDYFPPGCRHIKMDGIPREANDQDIAKFFRSVGVLPIRVHRNSTGKDAYVEFLSEDACKIALTKNHQHIGDRYVILKPASAADVARVVPQAVAPLGFHDPHDRSSMVEMRPRPPPPSYRPSLPERSSHRYEPYDRPTSMSCPPNAIVKMSGLPFEAKMNDIKEFFGGLKFIPESIKILQKNGKSTGTGRITFESVEEATRAIHTRQKNYIGDRYIHLTYWKQFR